MRASSSWPNQGVRQAIAVAPALDLALDLDITPLMSNSEFGNMLALQSHHQLATLVICPDDQMGVKNADGAAVLGNSGCSMKQEPIEGTAHIPA